ncbi:MAG TPA: hypothetical protein EYQ81_02925 [Sneathiellales bacterium]|jgi:hypothetical protein|nr:hypothetical protein [Sneathiellales bacterium]
MRVGQHDNFVRVVLDFNHRTEYSSGFDPDGRMILRLLSAKAVPKRRRLGADNTPISRIEITASPDGNGSIVAIESDGPISNKVFALTPDEIGSHRIVIELAPLPSLND